MTFGFREHQRGPPALDLSGHDHGHRVPGRERLHRPHNERRGASYRHILRGVQFGEAEQRFPGIEVDHPHGAIRGNEVLPPYGLGVDRNRKAHDGGLHDGEALPPRESGEVPGCTAFLLRQVAILKGDEPIGPDKLHARKGVLAPQAQRALDDNDFLDWGQAAKERQHQHRVPIAHPLRSGLRPLLGFKARLRSAWPTPQQRPRRWPRPTTRRHPAAPGSGRRCRALRSAPT